MTSNAWLNIKKWWRPPISPDEEETRLAKLVIQIAWIVLLVSALTAIPSFLIDQTRQNLLATLLGNGLGIGGSLLALWWARQGRAKRAGWTIILMLMIAITLSGLIFGLALFPMAVYIMVIAMSGLLIGPRGALYTGVASMTAILLVVYVNVEGLFNRPAPPERIFADTLTTIVVIILTSSLLYITVSHLHQTLTRSRNAEAYILGLANQRQAAIELSKKILTTFSLDELIEHTLSSVKQTLPSDGVCFYWVNESEQTLRVGGRPQGYMDFPALYDFQLPLGKGIIGNSASSGFAEYVNDAYLDPRVIYPPGFSPDMNNREHLMVLPVQSHGRVLAVIVAGRFGKDAKPFTKDEFEHTQILVNQAALAVDNVMLFAETRNNEARFRALAENLPGVIYQCKNDSKYSMLYVSDMIGDLTGYHRDEFLDGSLSLSDLYHPEDAVMLVPRPEDESFDRGQEPFHFEFRIRHRDGGWRWIEDRGASVFNATGEFLYLEGFLLDITARKQAEADIHNLNFNLETLVTERTGELHKTTRLLQALMDNAPMSIFIKSAPDWKYTMVNKQYESFRGQTAAQIANQTDYSFYPTEQANQIRTIDEKVLAERTPLVSEINLPDAEGMIHTLLSTKFPIVADDNQLLAIGGISLDITERKRAEDGLREAESKFRTLVEQIPAVIYTDQADSGETQFISPYVETMLGYSPEDWLANPQLCIDLLHPQDRDRVSHETENAQQTGRFVLEYRYMAKGDRVVWVRDEAILLKDESGNPKYWQGVMIDITERKRIEEALHVAEAKYREIYENIQDVIYETDPRGRVTTVSPSIEKQSGYHPAEILGQSTMKFFSSPDEYTALMSNLIEKGEVNDYEVCLKRKDGSHVFASATIQIRYDQTGAPLGTRGVLRDITARKQVQEALRVSEDRYRTLIEELPLVVYTNPANDINITTYISPQIEDYFGYSQEEWYAKAGMWKAHLHKDDLQPVLEASEDCIRRGDTFNMEYRMVNREGHTVWIHDRALLLSDSEGNALLRQGMMTDITRRKEIEAELHQANTELEERVADRTFALQSANNLLHALEEATVVLNKTLELNEVLDRILEQCRKLIPCRGINLMLIEGDSAYIARRIGYEGYAELERDLSDFRYPLTWATLNHMTTTGQSIFLDRTAGHPKWHTPTANSWVQSFIGVPLQAAGKTLGFLNASDDQPGFFKEEHIEVLEALANHASIAIQNARLHEDLQKSLSNEQAARSQLVQNERLALVGRLLASVSHELNNPLQAIQNALFLIKDEAGLSNQGKQDVEIILSEADRMASLIERLRETYRPIRIEDFKSVQLNTLVEEVYSLTSTHMRHRGVSFEFHPEPALPEIPALPDQLRQVLLNLFLNAVEAMPSGGNLIIHTENLPDSDEVYLSITDSGTGIDPHILPQIFSAFVTNKATGTGLGLTISHDIIQQHRGRILAESPADGGAKFNIWLPAHKKEPS